MSTWLLLLAKSAACGKSRLAPVLDDAARGRLNTFFLRRALALGHRFPGRSRTAVISDCTSILALAESHGFRALLQTAGPTLNDAAAQGAAELFASGATQVLLLPCDVPTVRAEDIRQLVLACGEQPILCPDKSGDGTNALVVPRIAAMRYHFGHRSLQKHCQELARLGFRPRVHRNARIAFDIDTAADLRRWSLQYPDQAARAGVTFPEGGALLCA